MREKVKSELYKILFILSNANLLDVVSVRNYCMLQTCKGSFRNETEKVTLECGCTFHDKHLEKWLVVLLMF